MTDHGAHLHFVDRPVVVVVVDTAATRVATSAFSSRTDFEILDVVLLFVKTPLAAPGAGDMVAFASAAFARLASAS